MSNSLAFDNNWRRSLLLTKQASQDVDRPAWYIVLNNSKLPCKFSSFCQQYASEYGFDYDLTSGVLWPSDDSISASVVVTTLNTDFPKCASLINKPPAIVHNLSFFPEESLAF